MRELREFREHHEEFRAAGIALVGINADTIEGNRRWTERLGLPYPVLSDPERDAARALGVVLRLGIGAWNIELFRRTTFLVDVQGIVNAVWGKVKIRGHAEDVLSKAKLMIVNPPG
ncbi:MAG TPA: redoxin domain-containing protein [Candidatus Limnocylindria bacterium]|nr:redoxin domain-containing protein [Candidatus Limnocylindria bacterium]